MDSGNSPPVETPRSEFSCKNFVFELYHYLFFFDFVFQNVGVKFGRVAHALFQVPGNKENHDVKKLLYVTK